MTRSENSAFFMIIFRITLDDPYPDTGESGETYDVEMAKRPLVGLVPNPFQNLQKHLKNTLLNKKGKKTEVGNNKDPCPA
jgi:hypothetical protein